MNKTFYIYHFTKPSENTIAGYASRIYDHKAVICFDLEDIVKETIAGSDNSPLRQILRSAVSDTVEFLFHNFKSPAVGIRINNINSSECDKDINLLNYISGKYVLESVFLPKTETSDDIRKCMERLEKEKVCFNELIPIIEDRKGLQNLEQMAEENIIRKVAFGHCDYNYDCNYFPFYHQNSAEYWKWIDHILPITEKHNITFINSPYLQLNDDSGFIRILNNLSRRTSKGFGQITLSENQVELCFSYTVRQYNINKNAEPTDTNLTSMALFLINEFNRYKLYGKSISLNHERIVISPQEYMAAVRYLESAGKEYAI